MQPGKAKSVRVLIDAALRGELTKAQAGQLCKQGREAVILALLAVSKRIAEQDGHIAKQDSLIAKQDARIAEQDTRIAELQGQSNGQPSSPSTPSGMLPVYTKPDTPKRRKRPGAKPGHRGRRRAKPKRIDRRRRHRLKRCPHCNGRLQRCHHTRTRITEDIPEPIEPVVTEHTIHRDYCPKCKKHVEPVVPDALPRATMGHHLISLTSWLHYGLGVTIDQMVEILSYHLQTNLTPGGLVEAWQRLAVILAEWYEQIAEQAKKSTYLHADETGWRVNGQGHWLWCFTNDRNCYYMIDRCRGSPALKKFFTEAFDGVLITDFWAAYESVEARDRQYCLAHLLRELEKVDQHNDSAEWRAFAKKLRRLLADGMRLCRPRSDLTPEQYQNRCNRLNRRLADLADADYADADVRRLAKRLRRHREHIFAFLDYPEVDYGRVGMWRGGLGRAYLFPPLSSGGASVAQPYSVSTSRSSNRTCGFPASGSRTDHSRLRTRPVDA